MFQRILVALDRNQNSRIILEEAIALAKSGEAQLHLVTVLLPMETSYIDPMYFTIEGTHGAWTADMYQSRMVAWRQHQQEIDCWLSSQVDYVQRQRVSADYSYPIGSPGETLCKLAANWNADLIMMGRRGRSGFSELLLGSVSNYVMHHAPCSVLTIQGILQPAMAAGAAPVAVSR
ncbi:MAG: universal stress protein [Cyanobacteria bacterium P01_D01_bin.156]